MKSDLSLYLESIKNRFPATVIEGLSIILIMGLLLIIVFKGRHSGRVMALFLLALYTCVLLSSTVVFRVVEDARTFELTPFWSYSRKDLIVQNLMNVLAFVPVGILSSCVFNRAKWWQVLLIGFGLSLSIEVLQYVLRRGFAEFDDVFHNTLGCFIGIVIVGVISTLWKFSSDVFSPHRKPDYGDTSENGRYNGDSTSERLS